MPHPSSRLDIYIVPQGGRREVHAMARALFDEWVLAGWVLDDGSGMPGMEEVVPRGCRRVRLDLPESRVLYANQQGGFRAQCMGCGASVAQHVTALVSPAVPNGKVNCGQCGCELEGGGVKFSPHAAFGFGAMVLCDVGSFELTPGAKATLTRALGPYDVVGKRV